jgi:hypothetical protein
VKNPIRNETSLVLMVAVIFSAIAIPALSGFLEPSQPPAVASVQIGNPHDGGGNAVRDDGAPAPRKQTEPQPEPEPRDRRPAGDAEPRRPAPRPATPTPATPAPSAPPATPAPADDAPADDDDGGGED